jgi:hypothetical protein
MTTTHVEKIGYCAHDSKEGDWAFEIALMLAKQLNVQLNVFGFLLNPYEQGKNDKYVAEPVEPDQLVRLERDLRFRYDEAAGDYVNVGFRLCHDGAWYELHRCLCRREFQILVLAKPTEDANFLGKPLDQFIESFICPTILVGPGSKERIQTNHAAKMIRDQIYLPQARIGNQQNVASSSQRV